jgi:thiamine monophosphate kinase
VRSLNLRHFPKVEKWTRDGTKVDSLLYAGNSLGRAQAVFENAIKHRPRIRLAIRQRTRVLKQWPP